MGQRSLVRRLTAGYCSALSEEAFQTQCLPFPLCCSGTHMGQGSKSGLPGELQAGGGLRRPSRWRCRWFSLVLLAWGQRPASTHEPLPCTQTPRPHPICSQKLRSGAQRIQSTVVSFEVGLAAASHCCRVMVPDPSGGF